MDLRYVRFSIPTHLKSTFVFGRALDSQERVCDLRVSRHHSRWRLLEEEALYDDQVKETLRLLSDKRSFLIRYRQASVAVEHSDPIACF